MVQTITPVVHGGRRGRWIGSVAAYTLGATLSAAAFGAFLSAAGRLLGAPWGSAGLWALAAVAALYATRELFSVQIPLPNLHRQVPDWWRTFFSPPVASVLYGLGLGVGFLTYITFGTLVAVAAAAVVSGSALAGAVIVGAFGLARGLSVLVAWPGTTEEQLAHALDRLDAFGASRAPALVNGLLLAGITVASGAAAVGAASTSGSGIAAVALAAVFTWAALSKILRPAAWWASLEQFALGWMRRPIAVAVPVAELAVPVLVAAGLPVEASVLAIVMLVTFSLSLLRARRLHGNRVACGCFGRTRARDYRLLLARNAAIALVAAASLAAPATPWGSGSLRAPHGLELLPTILALAGLVLVVAIARAVLRVLQAGRRDTSAAG
jgi:methylamine utilization protein MauE